MMRIKQVTENRYELNKNLAQIKGGVIMDVQNPELKQILQRLLVRLLWPWSSSSWRAAGGVSRMSDPKMIKGNQTVNYSSNNESESDILFEAQIFRGY